MPTLRQQELLAELIAPAFSASDEEVLKDQDAFFAQ